MKHNLKAEYPELEIQIDERVIEMLDICPSQFSLRTELQDHEDFEKLLGFFSVMHRAENVYIGMMRAQARAQRDDDDDDAEVEPHIHDGNVVWQNLWMPE